jgi:hypothetical protein
MSDMNLHLFTSQQSRHLTIACIFTLEPHFHVLRLSSAVRISQTSFDAQLANKRLKFMSNMPSQNMT